MSQLVFVYGTLRRNQGNDYLLRDAAFVDDAVSLGKGFIIRGRGPVPYLTLLPGTARSGAIKGEIWDVPESIIPALDRLEGHPNWYRREQHAFQLHDGPENTPGTTVTAWVYLIPGQEQMAHDITTFHVPGEGGILEHPRYR